MDIIKIKSIIANGCHGVYQEEKLIPQKFIIDLKINCDLERASISDELENSVNYAEIDKKVCQIVSIKNYNLIEKLGREILIELFKTNALISAIEITVKKPDAKLLNKLTKPSITLKRNRQWYNEL